MRLFEELRQFAMNHRTLQLVDAVNVVPGVFTAFRRSVAIELGGFTVGMNGEDGDFTLRFSRMGYRSQLDPRVVAYEDVPPTYMEIREQRVRWDRSTIHNHARHGPWRAGLATPKVWFSHTHQFFTRVFAPIRVTLPFYLLLTAIFEGTYRNVILLLFGAWIVFLVAYMALEGVLAFIYHKERHLAWVLLYPFWMVCSTIFSTESWLSLPGRPAGLRGTTAAVVEKAVVH
jgi:cellulose synthase/poly-beta-1,6-N-acetylglucosamine synthase-like glycosyltransferase